MMKFSLAIVLAFGSMQAYSAQDDVFATCASEPNDALRLICYDEFATADANEAASTSFSLNSKVTEPNVSSQEGEREVSKPRRNNLWLLSKLSADDPNFFGYSTDPSSANRGVKDHLEFEISLKYPLWEWKNDSKLYFIYNGSYDFQALSREKIYDSKPIISTSQNPGIAFEWNAGNGNGKRKFRLGVFHHSNGQTLSESNDEDESSATDEEPWIIVPAVDEFQRIAARWKEAPALERVSRSSWYTQFRYQEMRNSGGIINDDWWQYQLEIRPWYFKNDDRIFWPPVPRHQPQIENFDGLRAVGEIMFTPDEIPILQRSEAWRYLASKLLPRRILARAEAQTGLWSPFENVGGQLSLGINIDNFILSAYYYSGFAKDIAAYHKRTKHLGIGLELR